MSPLLAANLGLRFLLELAALASLGIWGAQAVEIPEPARIAVELIVFAAAALGLAAAGYGILAVVFAVVAVANSALVRLARR